MNKTGLILLFSVLMLLGISALASLAFGNNSVFAFYKAKGRLARAEATLEDRRDTLATLRHRRDLIKNDTSISRDMLESESIRQLSRVPRGYFVLSD
ncbi:MAG: hypothetical protein FWD15_06025 [Alphaproteobacteria bacterium]|nr:hypothetical protein [Alphaproteobacteria bacterium]